MKFSEKQQAVITKAIQEKYLAHLLSDEVIAWLGKVEPKTTEDASIIVGSVLAIAYGRGEEISSIWNPELRRSAIAFKAEELGRMMVEYTARTCPSCHKAMGKFDHGICGDCNAELSGQNSPRSLTMLMETRD